MLIDGRKLASDIADNLRDQVADLGRVKLLVIQVGEDPATESFIKMKKAFADRIGVDVLVKKFPQTVEEKIILSQLQRVRDDDTITGIIVQLPLPGQLDTKKILDAIPSTKDPDLLSSQSKALYRAGQSSIFPPVVAAIEEILQRYYVDVTELNVVVAGYGSLVGEPVTVWLKNKGVEYALVTSETEGKGKILSGAELVISGAGVPSSIKPEMIQEGVVIIDAGTSESPSSTHGTGNRIVGDADPACAGKAALMTPVPGGVGPVAVAMLFRNLIELARHGQVEENSKIT